MRTEYLSYFLELARVKSMNKAAKNLYITQPTLRSAIMALEKEIGAPLINTSKQGTELTMLGELVVKEAPIVQSYIQGWKNQALENQSQDVAISSFGAVCRVLFPQFMFSFKSAYPQINIILKRDTAKSALTKLQNGLCSFALIMSSQKDEKEMRNKLNNSFTITNMYSDYYVVYLNANHPLAQKDKLQLSDLLPYLYVNYSELDLFDPQDYTLISEMYAKNMVYMDTLENIFSAISQNKKAFSILTHVLCFNNEYIAQNKIVTREISDLPATVNHYLVSPAPHCLNKAEKNVLKYLTNFYRVLDSINS